MKPSIRLRLEQLEDRSVPAVWGNPWPDAEHLTLSFAPDGTNISGVASSLDQTLGSNTSAWETVILKAFQTWAVTANVNIGIVSDNGNAFGTGGAIEGDPRFGDIRVGARPLAADVVAVTSPYDMFSTFSGTVILNSNDSFSTNGTPGTYDLYTVLLHESGHVFGFGDNTNPSSIMYDYYQGTWTGLSAGDISSMQGLYGVRTPDQFDAVASNDTQATATTIRTATTEADITTKSDVDWYKFTTTVPLVPVTVSLNTAGLSLLTPELSVYNSAGKLINSTESVDPLNGNLTLTVSSLLPQTYYVKVQSDRSDAFGIGSYQLNLSTPLNGVTGLVGGLLGVLQSSDPEVIPHSNDTMYTATPLTAHAATDAQVDVNYAAALSDKTDVDFYAITAPPSDIGATNETLLVNVWAKNGSTLDPTLNIYDGNQNLVAAEVLTKDGNADTVQFASAVPGAKYYLRVASQQGATGNYELAVNFQDAAINVPLVAAGSLTASSPAVQYSLGVNQTSFFHFALSDTTAAGSTGSVTMTIYDSNGNVVTSLTAGANDTQSADVMLAAGTYNVVFTQTGTAPMDFDLLGYLSTDPVGVQTSNSTNSTNASAPNGTWTATSGNYTAPTTTSSGTKY